MIRRTCDACGQIIAEDDRQALRDLPMYDVLTSKPRAPVDYDGRCVAIIQAELPRLAREAREARRAAANEPVRSRALSIWGVGGARLDVRDTRRGFPHNRA